MKDIMTITEITEIAKDKITETETDTETIIQITTINL
jgi:hypothetical protein